MLGGILAMLGFSLGMIKPKGNESLVLGLRLILIGGLLMMVETAGTKTYSWYQEGNRIEVSVLTCDEKFNFLSASFKYYKGEDLQRCSDIKGFSIVPH